MSPERCEPGQKVVEIQGLARELLTAERTCLNWLQTLSAVASKTAQYVKAVEGTPRCVTNLTASSLNSRLNFLLVTICHLQFHLPP
ncbi:hypothetical protein [Limnohabitans sp.]|uniref:hypothetical protein n=1 Tax=Limnohabitans sp. TaxID=1907725 RepID=UPI003C7483B5